MRVMRLVLQFVNGIIASLLVLNSVQVLCEAAAAGTAICVSQIIITLPVPDSVQVLCEAAAAGTCFTQATGNPAAKGNFTFSGAIGFSFFE